MKFIFFVFLNFLKPAYTLDITGCIKETQSYTLSFNYVFNITGIKYNFKEYSYFNMPYDEFHDRKFENIYVSSRKTYMDILNSIRECDRSFKNTSKKPDYKIIDIKKLNSKSRIANLVVSFDDEINVIFGLIKKNNFYIVYPPKNFKFIDDEYKKKFNLDIIDKWKSLSEGEEK
ncbi:MAG: hypothetical protein K6357_00475 [Elusimicrobiota bacterium]